MDIFGRFSRSPDCLVAIDAADGGTWRSPFRPGVVYPAAPYGSGSFETRTGLITKTNIKTSNGYFEAGNTAIAARIDTPLDLRGRVSSYTSVVRFTAATLTTDTTKQELCGQGSAIAGSERMPICALAYYRGLGSYSMQIAQEIGGVRVFMNTGIASALSGVHTAVGVVEVRSTQTVSSIYLDGVLLRTQTYNGIPTGVAYAGFANFSINDNRNGAWSNYFGKFHNVLLFDRPLSIGEIQLLR